MIGNEPKIGVNVDKSFHEAGQIRGVTSSLEQHKARMQANEEWADTVDFPDMDSQIKDEPKKTGNLEETTMSENKKEAGGQFGSAAEAVNHVEPAKLDANGHVSKEERAKSFAKQAVAIPAFPPHLANR